MVIRKDDILMYQTLYYAENQEMSATEMARILRWKDKMTVVGKMLSLGRKIERKYGIIPRMREDGSKSYWDIFFEGYQEGRFFIFRLRPELKAALEECRMEQIILPENFCLYRLQIVHI